MSGRVWDPYLSESDRQWLDARPERPQRLGSSPALLMIDLYRGGFGDAPQPLAESVKRWPWSCGMNAWNALPAIVQLLAAARRARIPVIHSTMRSSADGLAGWMDALHAQAAGTLAGNRADADAARAREIIPEAAPLAGEAVIEKTAPSAFAFTPLLAHLRDLGVDTVLVAGMAFVDINSDPNAIWVPPTSTTSLQQNQFNAVFNPFYRIEQVIFSLKPEAA